MDNSQACLPSSYTPDGFGIFKFNCSEICTHKQSITGISSSHGMEFAQHGIYCMFFDLHHSRYHFKILMFDTCFEQTDCSSLSKKRLKRKSFHHRAEESPIPSNVNNQSDLMDVERNHDGVVSVASISFPFLHFN